MYVFACGPWLGRLFPDVIGDRVTPTRQEEFFFGTPGGDGRFGEDVLPVWADGGGARFMYGVPGNRWRGFKVADDSRGPAFDPTAGECQYEQSPDEHYIVDRHASADNLWLVGGGSGHGFKHGPAVGELVAGAVLDRALPDPLFRLSRFPT